MPSGGRHRQLRAHTMLVAIAFAIEEGRPAHLAQGLRMLNDLPAMTRRRLGVAVTRTGNLVDATYRQFSHTNRTMLSAIDPAPVPTFNGVAEDGRAAHLASVREVIDAVAKEERLQEVLDALVEASVPERYKSMSRSLAVDWTDHETWSRPRAKDDPQPANDPTASWGHAKRNAPGATDHLFFGYYGQVATVVKEERAPSVPELVRAYGDDVAPGDVLCDCGYSNRDPETFASPLRRAGASLVMDLHPTDRGPRGTHEGAIVWNGNLYCPADMRRTASERTFSWFKDPASAGIRPGWSRLFGRAPNALMYALLAVVRNVRLVLAHEDREKDATRRAAIRRSPFRSRRRRGAEPACNEPANGAPDPTPGWLWRCPRPERQLERRLFR